MKTQIIAITITTLKNISNDSNLNSKSKSNLNQNSTKKSKCVNKDINFISSSSRSKYYQNFKNAEKDEINKNANSEP